MQRVATKINFPLSRRWKFSARALSDNRLALCNGIESNGCLGSSRYISKAKVNSKTSEQEKRCTDIHLYRIGYRGRLRDIQKKKKLWNLRKILLVVAQQLKYWGSMCATAWNDRESASWFYYFISFPFLQTLTLECFNFMC